MEAFTWCKELWTPKTFNKFSFLVNVVWIVLGIVLLGMFLDMETNESRFDFRCDVNSAKIDKDFIRGKCFVQYEKLYNKLAVPLYGFVIINFFLPLLVCVMYSQYVKSRVNQLQTRNANVSADAERQDQHANPRPQRKLFPAYSCQLASRLCIGIVFICFLQTELFYPRRFPSNFKCNFASEAGNQSVNATGMAQTYECNNQQAHKKTSLAYAVRGANGILAVFLLIEIFIILLRVRNGKKFMDDIHFYADHLKSNNDPPEWLQRSQNSPEEIRLLTTHCVSVVIELQPKCLAQLQRWIKCMKESVINNTERLRDLSSSPFKPNPGESNKHKDLRLDQIHTNLVIYYGRAYYRGRGYYVFPENRREQLKVCPKPQKNLQPTKPGDIVDVHHKNILVVGPPGIGKTLFCTKFMRDWASDRLFVEAQTTELRFDFAFLLKFRRLNSKEEINLRELLHCSEFSTTVNDVVWYYILENPNKVLFVFDGIDEFSGREDIRKDDSSYKDTAEEKMPLYALYKKIASRKLLDGATVLTTTRPTAASCLTDIDFSRMFQILGFSSHQVEDYVEKFTDDDTDAGETIWRHISNNLNLFSLCYIPVNCFIICSCLLHILQNLSRLASLPTKLTHIYSFAIKLFFFRLSDRYRTETANQDEIFKPFNKLAEKVKKDLKKLGKIAFKGTEEGRLTFESNEVTNLEDCGLLHRLPDLNTTAERPDKGAKEQYCFLHLTMQEFLAAKHITDTMNKAELREFVSRHIRDGAWQVVLQFVAGLLSDQEEPMTDIFTNLLPVSTYRGEELDTLTCWPSDQDKRLAMTLCHCLYEIDADDSAVRNNLREIGFNAVLFRDCQLRPVDCTALVNCLKMYDEIVMIDLSINNIQSLGCKEISQLMSRSDSKGNLKCLKLDDSSVFDEGVKYFAEALKHSNCKLESLNLSLNGVTDEGVLCLAEALTHSNCKLKCLDLSVNNITDEGVKYLAEALKHSNCKLESLDLSANNITDEVVKYLAEALKHSNCKLESLDLSANNITVEGVKYLDEALKHSNCKLKCLDRD